jgi:glycosyltransferase involved in cell wall biosynthesis
MRIALVAPFGLRAKGTARARALPLGKALVRRGHEVSLFVPPYDSPQDSGLCWQDDGVEVVNIALPGQSPLAKPDHPAQPGTAGQGSLWHLRLAWELFRAVRAGSPAIVHVFKPKGPSGLVGLAFWLARRSLRSGPQPGAPWPRVVVDADDWEGPGGWNDDPRSGYSPSQRRFFAWQERYGLSHAHAWTVASHCLRDRAVGFGADPGRVNLLPNGVDAPAVTGADRRLDPGGPPTAILYTRFAGVRVADIAGIWRRVVAGTPVARLLVVGCGLAGEELELARSAPNVDVVGWLEPSAMPPVFARACVALLPWADTPSNRARNSAKVLELMMAGLPSVAYAVGELPVTLGAGGILLPPGDEPGFAAAALALLNDPGQSAALGAAARARAQDQYTWDRLAEAALRAYELGPAR